MLKKADVHHKCLEVIAEKIEFIQNAITDLVKGGETDAKSSAGDKHETARAMLQAEQQKLSLQLTELQNQNAALQKINLNAKPSVIVHGTLINTDKGYLYLAVAIGKISVGDQSIIVLSPASPLGKVLTGLSVGSSATLTQTVYAIQSIQ